MRNSMKNSKGFISLSVVFVMMVFLSLYLTAAFSIALSQQRDYARSTCVTEASQIQSSTLKKVRYLFSLNEASTALRLNIKATKMVLALAIASMNFEAIPALERKLSALYEAQKTLHETQQALITVARAELFAKHSALVAHINYGNLELSYAWRFMLKLSSRFTPRFTPALAIRPDSEGGIGPNYEWDDEAERKQTLAYTWKMSFQTNVSYQRFFNWFNTLTVQCSVSPNLKDKKWQLTINADK